MIIEQRGAAERIPSMGISSLRGHVRHIEHVLRELRHYIAAKEDHAELEEIDTLLSVAQEEVRRKLAQKKGMSRLHSSPAGGK